MQKIKCEFVAELIGSNTRGNKIQHGIFPQLGTFEATQVTIRVRAKTLLYGGVRSFPPEAFYHSKNSNNAHLSRPSQGNNNSKCPGVLSNHCKNTGFLSYCRLRYIMSTRRFICEIF